MTPQQEATLGAAIARQAKIDMARAKEIAADRPNTYKPPAKRQPPKPTKRMAEILAYVRENPDRTAAQIAHDIGIKNDTVRRTLRRYCEKGIVDRTRTSLTMPYRFRVAK